MSTWVRFDAYITSGRDWIGSERKRDLPHQPDHAGPSWLPPVRDGVGGKKWKCHAIHDRPSTGKHIIDAVRDANTSSVRAEVVVVDQPWRQIPMIRNS